MKTFRTLLFVLAACLMPVSALAASAFVGVSQDAIRLEASKGGLMRLDRPAATIFVSDPRIADVQVKSPRLIYISAKQPGETTLYAVDQNERVVLSRHIAVSHNVTRLKAALRTLLPDAPIHAESVNGTLVLSGSVRSASDAEAARRLALGIVSDEEDLVNKIAVNAPSQVHLRVRVAEVTRDVLKQFGINWDAIINTGNFVFGLATGSVTNLAGTFVTRNNFTNSVFGGFRTGTFDVNGLIDALDREGLVTVLAEPNLTAISGETASFLAGGEFPIVVPDDNGGLAIQFKQFGVSLSFTPTIAAENRINLKVSPEVSQLSTEGQVLLSGFSIPAISTRRASTTVELGSGQSFAVAGLLQNNVTRDVRKFPGLADLPVLGSLFRSDEFRRNESELVIIVTPYLVRPVGPGKLASPTDEITPPTDIDRIVRGKTYRPTLTRNKSAAQDATGKGLVGPAGFVMD